MRNACVLIFCFCFIPSLYAQKITGKVVSLNNEVLSFASIVIQGTPAGVSANAQGVYSIELKPGKYTLACQYIGYKKAEQEIVVEDKDQVVNFVMQTQQYHLTDVVVHSGGVDPAYEIIRKVIQKRPAHEKELKKFLCSVYIKGDLRLRNFPSYFLGKKIDFEDGNSDKNKILLLSETLARYSFQQPNYSKLEVVSTRVSGDRDGYGLSSPQIISFYKNIVSVGQNLSPRGFISPIADNAMHFYNYAFEGSFFEEGKMISRIRVMPKRKFEPLFKGYINIIEDEWRIQSVQLLLLKDYQLQLLDSLQIDQQYVHVNDQWLIKQQVMRPSVKLFGFDAYGSFVQVYNDFNILPIFPNNYFDNAIIQFADSANKKNKQYWDSIRPVPLQTEETKDYQDKDSLEILKNQPHYIDSLDKVRNKLTVAGLLLTGQYFSKQREQIRYNIEPLLDIVNYNTVEGTMFHLSPKIEKIFKRKEQLEINPNIRYGLGNQHLNAYITSTFTYGKNNLESFYFSAGKKVFQFNNSQPILPRTNTISTLYYEENLMKLYEATFVKMRYTKALGDAITLSVLAEYQNRFPLENTSFAKWRNFSNRDFTPNYPTEIIHENIPQHNAFITTEKIIWRPGTKYIQLPDRRISLSSKYPSMSFSFTQGWNGFLNSNVNYAKWQAIISDDLNLKLAGKFRYKILMGGFLNDRKLYLPDLYHFNGNTSFPASEYLNSYQLLSYYRLSNADKFYSSAHVEYHLNGLLTNKIPFVNKLNLFLVLGANGLYTSSNKHYYETFFSIENIFRVVRLDFIQSFSTDPQLRTTGMRISFSGLLMGSKEE